jgi:hypothetical protein
VSRNPDAPRDPAGAGPALVWVAIALLVVLASQYGGAWRVPFINDDYVFLDRVRDAPFGSLWGLERLTFHWWRPWSREFHYWWLSRAFGPWEPPFHAASLALWLAVHLLYFALAARLAGRRAATVATAGLALLAAWAVPVLWVAAVQDLWMLAFSLLALNLVARGRGAMAAVATALALLSKETAATLPAGALLLAAVAQRRSLPEAVRVTWPAAAVTAAWAMLHPLLGGALWRGPVARAQVAGGPGPVESARLTALSWVNLDRWPAPAGGWGQALVLAAPAAVAAAMLLVLALRGRDGPPPVGAGRVVGFGAAWAVLGSAPLLLPGLGWHAYYALAGACGAWLALGVALARSRATAIAAVIALAVLRAAAAGTPSLDWGTEWYQRRAAAFQEFLRADLARLVPRPAPHARFFFTGVPSHVGFLTEGAPALRAWYRDPTLSGGFFADYAPRRDGTTGPDRFFRYDSTSGWREIEPDAAGAGLPRDPDAAGDARELAAAFARAGEWRRAAYEYEAIAALPESLEAALDAGVARAMAADTAAARVWFGRVLASPLATPDQRASARSFLAELAPPGAPSPR